jgi:hypothetical protein
MADTHFCVGSEWVSVMGSVMGSVMVSVMGSVMGCLLPCRTLIEEPAIRVSCPGNFSDADTSSKDDSWHGRWR